VFILLNGNMSNESQSERVARIKGFLKSRTSVPCHSGDVSKATGVPKAMIDHQRSLSADPEIAREKHLDPKTGRLRVFWTHLAESVLVKHQLLILSRSRKRAPTLRLSDRTIAGLCALLIRPRRLMRSAIVLKPSTLLRLHRALTTRKYRRLFSAKVRRNPGPKGPTQEVIDAVLAMRSKRVGGSLQPSTTAHQPRDTSKTPASGTVFITEVGVFRVDAPSRVFLER
jgi:hypothetical protein